MKFNFDNTYTSLPSELFSVCRPTAVREPQLVMFNRQLAQELGLNAVDEPATSLAAVFSGNHLPPDAANIAQAYSGHQFGHFTRLGDGRAILLGEQITPDGRRFDLQFKGSGVTPYSRRGDGRATLSAMLREYIISEAMHALGIPTSRSLAVVATGEPVYREQIQMGAVLTRVAASHIRVGTFEHVARFCAPETLKTFTNYVIDRHYPELSEAENPALSLLETVMNRQIELIVNWMRVGFIHGVMNTDNMTISGETIDYGPCAFMNAYNPETVFSSIDTSGRYAFGNQAQIALWNLTRLAESLLSLIDTDTEKAIGKAENVLNAFQSRFEEKYLQMLAGKIGFTNAQDGEKVLIHKLLNWMYLNKADYSNTFVELMYPGTFNDRIYNQSSFPDWKNEWEKQLTNNSISKADALKTMQAANPVYIPRNHQVEMVLKQVTETGKVNALTDLMKILSNPYAVTAFEPDFMIPPSTGQEQNYKTYCGT